MDTKAEIMKSLNTQLTYPLVFGTILTIVVAYLSYWYGNQHAQSHFLKSLWTQEGKVGSYDLEVVTLSLGEGGTWSTEHQVVKDITWSRIELTPTIGSMPLLRYYQAGTGQEQTVRCTYVTRIL